jgi:NADP-dependent 3-hydroxy acid dehydrogenase YdfG
VTELSKQAVAIVGASSGIGLATAQAAALQGAKVIMFSRSRATLEAAAKTVQGNVLPIAMDMLDRAAVDRVMAANGAIDHLVLTAVADELMQRAPGIVECRKRVEALATTGYASSKPPPLSKLSPSSIA